MADENPNPHNIIEPGKTPPFPAYLATDASATDKTKIAEAAWAQSGGDIAAFEQLCADHVSGALNLLPAAEPAPARTTSRTSSGTGTSSGGAA